MIGTPHDDGFCAIGTIVCGTRHFVVIAEQYDARGWRQPTQDLDFVGLAALEAVLAAWPGGLLVVSHDPEFLDAIGISSTLAL